MLIVVVIIGILAAALTMRLQWAQSRTRDVIRKKDIKTAADALAIYYQDNQNYPLATDGENTLVNWWEGTDVLASWWILKSLVPAYTSKPFNDPLDWKKYRYAYARHNWKYQYENNLCCAAYISDPIRCNITWTPIYQANIMYRSENNTDTDRFRSCPDWTPRDLKPWATPYPAGQAPIETRMRWVWTYDDKIMAVGDNYDFSTVKRLKPR